MLYVSLSAAASVVLLAQWFPVLLKRSRWGLPISANLPGLHSAFKALVAAMATTASVGIQRVPEAVQPVALWLDLRVIAASAVLQSVLLMTLGSIFSKRGSR